MEWKDAGWKVLECFAGGFSLAFYTSSAFSIFGKLLETLVHNFA